MMRKQLGYWATLFIAMLATAAVALAQSDTARLQGTVTDPSGAAVVGAVVNVTSVETGRLTSVTTNDLGYYTATALPPSNYKVEVSQKGFKTTSRTLELQVAQIGVADFQLEVGEVTQTVTVEGGSPVINLQDSAIGEVVESRQITELPLNGRNFTQLATLVPGASRGIPTGSNSATGVNNNAETFRFGQEGGASLSVNGLRPQTNNFILDGIDNNETLVNTIVFFPPAEAIDEFRVQTSVAPAEFGRVGGALVVTSIKSGTNDIHGTAFWFNRNTNLNARDFFQGPPTPGFNRNQFGGTLGMPIFKNKLFVFGDYEGLRLKQPGPVGIATDPTDKMRKGDFSELLCGFTTTPFPTGAACSDPTLGISTPIAILDPTTGQQFVAFPTGPNANAQCTNAAGCPNIIPTNRINTVGQAYLNLFPEPNCSNAQNGACFTLRNNYLSAAKIVENWNDFDIRTDWVIDTKNTIFGRFSRARTDQQHATLFPNLPSCAGFGCGTNFNHPYGTSIGLTTILNANMVNEAHAGFVRTFYGFLNPFNGTDFCTQIGIVNCNTPLLGGIALIGGYNGQIQYTGDGGAYLIPQTGYDYSDNLTWTKGKHTVKVGGTILRRQLNLFRGNNAKGYFGLAGNGSGGAGGGSGHINTDYEVSDILAGFVDGYQHGVPLGTVGTRSWENGFFAQDDFRVTPRLTLNLGLRYDVLTWPVEVENRQANFDLTTGALIVAGSNGASRALLPNDYHNFGPRLGFAYQLTNDGKTVVRGGYGLFYFVDRGGIANQLAQNPPFAGQVGVNYAQGFRITFSGALACEPNCTNAQLIATVANTTAALPSGNFTSLNLANPTGVAVIADLPTNLTPRVSQWNLQVQREIAVNQSVSLAYVGTLGDRLTRNYNADQQLFGSAPGTELFPALSSVTVQDNRGKSYYHSLQAQYERRMTKGWQFLGSFTWSKTIDDACGSIDVCAPQLYTNYKIERGLSNQDQPYRMVLSSLYELPFGKGKRWGGDVNRWVNYAIGGWQINGIYTLQAGQPFNVTVDGSPSATRADRVGPTSINPGNLTQYITASGFAIPAATIYYNNTGNVNGFVFNAPGTSGRDILRGPGSSNLDFALFKNFAVTERVNARFILEAYNLTNTPHFANPNSDLGGYTTACPVGTNPCPNNAVLVFQPNSLFGHITSTIPFTYRQVELGLRVTF